MYVSYNTSNIPKLSTKVIFKLLFTLLLQNISNYHWSCHLDITHAGFDIDVYSVPFDTKVRFKEPSPMSCNKRVHWNEHYNGEIIWFADLLKDQEGNHVWILYDLDVGEIYSYLVVSLMKDQSKRMIR